MRHLPKPFGAIELPYQTLLAMHAANFSVVDVTKYIAICVIAYIPERVTVVLKRIPLPTTPS